MPKRKAHMTAPADNDYFLYFLHELLNASFWTRAEAFSLLPCTSKCSEGRLFLGKAATRLVTSYRPEVKMLMVEL